MKMIMMTMRRRKKGRQEENDKEKKKVEEEIKERDARRKWFLLKNKHLSLTLRKLNINLHLTVT